jgi:mannose-1-phosphate guanylyltransferase
MRGIVLVGGFGTRLRPLTNALPKPVLPIGHVPMIARLVRQLARGGVDDVTLALGFKPEPFLDVFPDGEFEGVALHYAVEPEPLDTAGAIRYAAEYRGIDETFVVANGDVLTDLDLGWLVEHHRAFGGLATIHLIGVDDPSAYGVIDLSPGGRVRRFVEKPAPGTEPSNLINAGTYVLEPGVLDLITLGDRVSIERATFPLLAERAAMFAVATDDYWIDTGRPDLYLQANLDVLAGLRRHDRCEAVAPGAIVAEAIVDRSLVGPGSTVDDGARLVESVILPGARVRAGANVVRSVVMGDVGSGAVVVESVIGAEGVVAADEHITGVRRPEPE